MMTAVRLRACGVSELKPGDMRRVDRSDGPPIAVYNVDGIVYATDDTCTHSNASLTEGDLEDDCIVCPVHQGIFHVPTGRALCFPVDVDLRTYQVEVENADVYVVMERSVRRDTSNPEEAA